VLNWVKNSAGGVERRCDGLWYKEAQLAADDFKHSHYDGIPPCLWKADRYRRNRAELTGRAPVA
jgi:hypothetical protein